MKNTTNLLLALLIVLMFGSGDLIAQDCIEYDSFNGYNICMDVTNASATSLLCPHKSIANRGALTTEQFNEIYSNTGAWISIPASPGDEGLKVTLEIESSRNPFNFGIEAEFDEEFEVLWAGKEYSFKFAVSDCNKGAVETSCKKSITLPAREPSINDEKNSHWLRTTFFNNNSSTVFAEIATRVVVTGRKVGDILYNATAPATVQLILRDPPGDQSYSFFGDGKVICQGYGMSYATDNSTSAWASVQLGAKGSKNFLVGEVESEVYVNVEGSLMSGIQRTGENEYRTCYESETRYETKQGALEGDVYIGSAITYQYGVVYDLTYSYNVLSFQCEPKVKKSLGIAPIGTESSFRFSEAQIRKEISSLKEQISTEENEDVKQLRKDQLEAYEQAVQLNEDIKKAALQLNPKPDIFDGEAGGIEKSVTTTSSQESSYQFNLYIEESIAVEVGAKVEGEIGGVGGSVEGKAGVGMRMRSEIGNSQNASNSETNTVGYKLEDDDPGDIIQVNIYSDPVFGTAVFALDPMNTKTSCPFEGGQRRDLPSLFFGENNENNINIYGIPLEESGLIDFRACNFSETNESRNYLLKSPQTRSASLFFSGAPLANGVEVGDVSPGTCGENKRLRIDSDGETRWYEDIQLVLTDNCTGDVESELVHLNVLFGDTGPNAPDNDAPCSKVPFELLNLKLINQTNINALALNYQFADGVNYELGLKPESWADNIEHSVWYAFTAPSEGLLDISTMNDGTNFSTQMALFVAGECTDFNSYILIAEDGQNNNGSLLEDIRMEKNQTYYLMVDGYGGATGNFDISFDFEALVDSDGDGIYDQSDRCPNFNDNLDQDKDGTPDGCDLCPDRFNPGLNFDGIDDYVDLGTGFGNFGVGDYTIELWVKTTQTTSGPDASFIPLISKRSGCGCGNFWTLKFDPNGYVQYEFMETEDCQKSLYLQNDTRINDGQWHHIAVTRLGGVSVLYIDGNPGPLFTRIELINSNNNDPVLLGKSGCSDLPWADYFRGEMDEVRIWHKGRTGEEIRSDRSRELNGNEDGLVAYYPLNEGIPGMDNSHLNLAFDFSGNMNNGVLEGLTQSGALSNWVNGAGILDADNDNDGLGRQCDPDENLLTRLEVVGYAEEINLQVFPNPTSGDITLSFYLQEGSPVSLQLSNMNGQRLRMMPAAEIKGAGQHSLNIPLQGIPSGVYYISLRTQQKVYTRRIAVVD